MRILFVISLVALAGCKALIGIEELPRQEGSPGVQIQFNSDYTTEQFANFPVLVVIDDQNFDMSQIDEDGSNLRFVDDDMTELAHEIEVWDSNGTSYVWVRVPNIPVGGDASFYLYYDKSDSPPAQRPHDVWSQYTAVYHLSDVLRTGMNDPIQNSATDDYHGSDEGTLSDNNSQPGQIGQSVSFGMSPTGNEHIHIEENAAVFAAEDGAVLALEAWFRMAPGPHFQQGRRLLWRDQVCDGWRLHLLADGHLRAGLFTDAPMGMCVFDFAIKRHPADPSASFIDDTWHYAVALIDRRNNVMRLFGNGVDLHSKPIDHVHDQATGSLYIGNTDQADESFPGLIDEVRISRKDLTPAWIRAQYASMRNQLLTFSELPQP